MPFKRSDWNDIIQQVNAVLQNPPTGTDCEPLPALEEVGPLHRWSKDDVQEVQDALKATCPSITFSAIPELWKQSIIDEITEAIGQAWCDCDEECNQELIDSENGTEFFLLSSAPIKVTASCPSNPDLLGNSNPDVPLADVINGMQVGANNIFGRTWQVQRRNFKNNGTTNLTTIASGSVGCNGTISYSGSVVMLGNAGIHVVCGSDCLNTACQDSIDESNANLSNTSWPFWGELFYSEYRLVITTTSAECGLPGDCP